MVTVREMIFSSLATVDPLPGEMSSGSVNVNPKRAIPESHTMVLLGSGLAGLGFFRRRRKREA